MARKLIFRLNVGLEDQAKYGIPNGPNSEEPPHEGDVMSIEDDKLANVLVNVIKCAEDFDAKKEAEREKQIRDFDDKNIAQHEAGLQTAKARTSRQFNRLDEPRTAQASDEAAEREKAQAKEHKAK